MFDVIYWGLQCSSYWVCPKTFTYSSSPSILQSLKDYPKQTLKKNLNIIRKQASILQFHMRRMGSLIINRTKFISFQICHLYENQFLILNPQNKIFQNISKDSLFSCTKIGSMRDFIFFEIFSILKINIILCQSRQWY